MDSDDDLALHLEEARSRFVEGTDRTHWARRVCELATAEQLRAPRAACLAHLLQEDPVLFHRTPFRILAETFHLTTYTETEWAALQDALPVSSGILSSAALGMVYLGSVDPWEPSNVLAERWRLALRHLRPGDGVIRTRAYVEALLAAWARSDLVGFWPEFMGRRMEQIDGYQLASILIDVLHATQRERRFDWFDEARAILREVPLTDALRDRATIAALDSLRYLASDLQHEAVGSLDIVRQHCRNLEWSSSMYVVEELLSAHPTTPRPRPCA